MITHDQDFTSILAVSGATTPSLINLRVSYVDAERLASLVMAVAVTAEADLLAGAIVTIDDGGVRVHGLPVS